MASMFDVDASFGTLNMKITSLSVAAYKSRFCGHV